MLKIVSLDILDVIPTSSGIGFVLHEDLPEGGTRVLFYSFNISTQQIQYMTKEDYLKAKFGSDAEEIAKSLGDYVSCEATKLWNDDVFVIFPSGEYGIFGKEGKEPEFGRLLYRDADTRDAAAENNYVWSVVPSLNMIVRYSPLQRRVIMRIGGDDSTTFDSPSSVRIYDDTLYVCNTNANTIKKVNLSDFSVSDYKTFDEPVYKYLRVKDKEFVVLSSGVYML